MGRMGVGSGFEKFISRRKKLWKERKALSIPGRENIGKYDEHGNVITEPYVGEVFNSQDEALDRRYSYSNKAANLLSSGRRSTLFGN